MASIDLSESNRRLTDPEEIRQFLSGHGITYEQWPPQDAIESPTADELLAAYAPQIEQLKKRGGYVTADVIDVTPDTPGLQAMLDRFNKEHTHAEDEVRFILDGGGVFHIDPPGAPVFAIQVEPGDLINVPAGTAHWFDLCADRRIRAIRLFREKAGWTPQYTGSGVDANYAPLCLGPDYLRGNRRPVIQALSLES